MANKAQKVAATTSSSGFKWIAMLLEYQQGSARCCCLMLLAAVGVATATTNKQTNWCNICLLLMATSMQQAISWLDCNSCARFPSHSLSGAFSLLFSGTQMQTSYIFHFSLYFFPCTSIFLAFSRFPFLFFCVILAFHFDKLRAKFQARPQPLSRGRAAQCWSI